MDSSKLQLFDESHAVNANNVHKAKTVKATVLKVCFIKVPF